MIPWPGIALSAVLWTGCSYDFAKFEGTSLPKDSGTDSPDEAAFQDGSEDSPDNGPVNPCENGKKDSDEGETGIDCGGPCLACPEEACVSDGQCVTNKCGVGDGAEGVCLLASGRPRWRVVETGEEMDPARFALGAAKGDDGRLFAVGGVANNTLDTVSAYTPKGRWTSDVPRLLHPRKNLAVVAAADDTLFAIGGRGVDGIPSNVVEMLSPAKQSSHEGTWEQGTALTTGIDGPAAALGENLMIYLFGGASSAAKLDEVYSCRPPGCVWNPVATMEVERQLAAASKGPCPEAAESDCLYVIGGLGVSQQVLSSVEAIRTVDDTWQTTPKPVALPEKRFALAASLGADGRIYAAGGSNGSDVDSCADVGLPTAFAFTASSNRWDRVPDLPRSPYAPAATTGDDGCVYVIGGRNGIDCAGNLGTLLAYCPRVEAESEKPGVITVSGDNFAEDARVHVYLDDELAPSASVRSDAAGKVGEFTVQAHAGSVKVRVEDVRSRYPVTLYVDVE